MIVDINDLLYEEALKYSSQDAQQADFIKEVFTFYIRASWVSSINSNISNCRTRCRCFFEYNITP